MQMNSFKSKLLLNTEEVNKKQGSHVISIKAKIGNALESKESRRNFKDRISSRKIIFTGTSSKDKS